MIIMLAGTRCRWAASALRASAAGGPACAASPGLIVAGAGVAAGVKGPRAGGVPLLLLLLRWRARLVASSGATYYYIILCNFAVFVNVPLVYAAGAAGLAAGRMICAGREKVPIFLAFSVNSCLTKLAIAWYN